MKSLTSWLLEELLSEKYRPHAVIREYEPGASIFRVGDPGDYLGVLLSGSIEIRKDGKSLSIAEAGAMFGEMGLIDRQPRMADAVAVARCRVIEVREGQFMALLESSPHFSLSVMRLLSDRLRRQVDT
ncbi:MAG: cyclic nucleotide-binding domain-containing protein [Pseudomonadota bacterium]